MIPYRCILDGRHFEVKESETNEYGDNVKCPNCGLYFTEQSLAWIPDVTAIWV